MKKAMTALLVMCGLYCIPVQAKNIGDDLYKVCRNDIFCDFENNSVKRIVTEVNSDGTFKAQDLAVWLQDQKVYEITIDKEEKDNTGEVYRKDCYYAFVPDRVEEEYWENEDINQLFFLTMVSPGDVIKSTGDEIETVKWIDEGFFGTEVKKVYPLLPADEEVLE